jgi:hypothetical protein
VTSHGQDEILNGLIDYYYIRVRYLYYIERDRSSLFSLCVVALRCFLFAVKINHAAVFALNFCDDERPESCCFVGTAVSLQVRLRPNALRCFLFAVKIHHAAVFALNFCDDDRPESCCFVGTAVSLQVRLMLPGQVFGRRSLLVIFHFAGLVEFCVVAVAAKIE